mmetsp:Transcript_12827/g.30592  ORF Transcript_12827/g.30592 Transcript_12827/m.30592 type:complete len:305 (-) Transcript_12827:80-994(-)
MHIYDTHGEERSHPPVASVHSLLLLGLLSDVQGVLCGERADVRQPTERSDAGLAPLRVQRMPLHWERPVEQRPVVVAGADVIPDLLHGIDGPYFAGEVPAARSLEDADRVHHIGPILPVLRQRVREALESRVPYFGEFFFERFPRFAHGDAARDTMGDGTLEPEMVAEGVQGVGLFCGLVLRQNAQDFIHVNLLTVLSLDVQLVDDGPDGVQLLLQPLTAVVVVPHIAAEGHQRLNHLGRHLCLQPQFGQVWPILVQIILHLFLVEFVARAVVVEDALEHRPLHHVGVVVVSQHVDQLRTALIH